MRTRFRISLLFACLLCLAMSTLLAQQPPLPDPFAPTPAPAADSFAPVESTDPFGLPTVFEYAFVPNPFEGHAETASQLVARATRAISFYANVGSARPDYSRGVEFLAARIAQEIAKPVSLNCHLVFQDEGPAADAWNKLKPGERLAAQLDRRVVLTLNQGKLAELRAELESKLKLPVLIDRKSLDDEAFDTTTPIHWGSTQPLKLRLALRTLLADLNLVYCTEEGTLIITTKTAAENRQIVRTYAVDPELLKPRKRIRQTQLIQFGGWGSGFGGGGGPPPLHAEYDEVDSLVNLLTSIIQPTTWRANGGMGGIEPNLQLGLLVVSNTEEVHDELAALLDVFKKKMAERKPPPIAPDAVERGIHPVVLPAVRLKQQNPLDHDRPISKEPAFTMDELVAQIKKQIEPASWTKPEHTISTLGQNLIVTQTRANQLKIHALLQQLGITKEQVDDEKQFADEQEQTRRDIQLRQEQERERMEKERVKRQEDEERKKREREVQKQ